MANIRTRILLLLGFIVISLNICECKECPLNNHVQDGGGEAEDVDKFPVNLQTQFNCPGNDDPEDFSECCSKSTPQCCPPEKHFYAIDNTIATAIAASVSVMCFVIAITVTICCFHNKCPLYNTCRVHYSSQGEILYGKENDSLNVIPADTPNKKNSYSCPRPSLNNSKTSLV